MATVKRRYATPEERARLLEKFDQFPPMSRRKAARLLNISAPLLCIWLQKRNKTRRALSSDVHVSETTCFEAALWKWIDDSRETATTLTDVMICNKAAEVAAEMRLDSFKATTGWLQCFKTREALVRNMKHAENATTRPTGPPESEEVPFKIPHASLIPSMTHQIEVALCKWIDHSRGNGISYALSDGIIRAKAKRLAKKFGFINFRASRDWLSRFKDREKRVRDKFTIDQKENDSTGPPDQPVSRNKPVDPVTKNPRNVLTSNKTQQIEAAVWKWIDYSRDGGNAVNEFLIRSKANRFARKMGFRNFRASKDWFARFKSRESLIRKRFHLDQEEESRNNQSELPKSINETIPVSSKGEAEENEVGDDISEHSDDAIIERNDDVMGCEHSDDVSEHSDDATIERTDDVMGCEHSDDVSEHSDDAIIERTDYLMGCEHYDVSEHSDDAIFERTDDVRECEHSDDATIEGTDYVMGCEHSEDVSVIARANDRGAAGQTDAKELHIPKREPTVITAEINGTLHTVTVPSLWQMKEAMQTLATGLLYRGFCDFKLLHHFEGEVDNVLRRSVALGKQHSFQV